MKLLIPIAAVALLLAACAKDEPPQVVLVTQPPAPPSIAAECTDADAAWVELPDADVKRGEAARNYRTNKDRYRSLLAKRRVCRAGLKAQFPSSSGSKE
jgi:uncharacterized lipoprotein YajG